MTSDFGDETLLFTHPHYEHGGGRNSGAKKVTIPEAGVVVAWHLAFISFTQNSVWGLERCFSPLFIDRGPGHRGSQARVPQLVSAGVW